MRRTPHRRNLDSEVAAPASEVLMRVWRVGAGSHHQVIGTDAPARNSCDRHAVANLPLDESDRLVERRTARTDVTHRDVLEPDRHAAEEHEVVGW